MKRVFVQSGIAGLYEAVQQGVAERGWADRVSVHSTREVGAKTEVVLGDPGLLHETIDDFDGLEWYQSTWAGVNKLFADEAKARQRTFQCTRAEGIFGEAMAEYVLSHVLFQERRMQETIAAQAGQQWLGQEGFRTCRRLRDLKLGIIGYGSIGRTVAEAAWGFKMHTVGCTRSSNPADLPEFVTITHDPREVFRTCDYVVNLLPETPHTKGLLTMEILSQGRTPAPVFINGGRGTVVADATVIEAVDSGVLSHAVLDVFAVEPLDAASPLWKHPKVTVTPHIAALTYLPDITKLFLDNLGRYLEGETLRHAVSWDAGY